LLTQWAIVLRRVNFLMLIGSRLDLGNVKDSTLVLIGPGCLPLPSDQVNLSLDQYRILECPWRTPQDRIQAFEEVEVLYKDLSPVVAELLNKMHSLQKSILFWKVFLGPWFYWLVSVVYDKYFRLQKAKEENGKSLARLPSKSFIIPQDTLDFSININHSDHYNLQLITSVARLIDFPVIDGESSTSLDTTEICFQSKNRVNLKVWISQWVQKLFYRYADTILYHSGHSSRFILDLFLKSRGNIVGVSSENPTVNYPVVDASMRKALQEGVSALIAEKNIPLLKAIVLRLAADQIPVCFLEGFGDVAIAARKKFGSKVPKKIVSAVGWYGDEVFKFWAAECSTKGTQLVGVQHGGNYGIVSHLLNENYEIDITDQYITWGFENYSNKKLKQAPAQKLIDIKERCSTNLTSDDILFIGTSGVRFFLQFPDIPENFSTYFKNQKNFVSTISLNLSKKLKIRLHHEDRIWEIKNRLQEIDPHLRFETWDVPFRSSMEEVKLVVCDHLSTTFIEVLSANIPIILFWDPDLNPLRASAQPCFERFREVGILHDSGESAAEFLNQHYDNITEWWYAPECQKAVKDFCKQFARRSNDPVADWYNVLKT
jgi:putative transferase (TIGR04331 family)